MNSEMLLHEMQQHLDELIAKDTPEAQARWQEFLLLHPADIAQFLTMISREDAQKLFLDLSQSLRLEVFAEFITPMKVLALSFLTDQDKAGILNNTPIDELTDLFDELSDEELKDYLTLLSTQDRQKVLSLLKFDPESAGGIMNTDVLTLLQDFTVEKCIHVLQRLQPRRDLHQQIYVTDQDNRLVGHIQLEDLVLKNPKDRLSSFLRKNELVVLATEDREEVAKKMIHYGLMTVPVINDQELFLGVISSDTLVDVIEKEASEDVYRISAMTPIKYPYFETSFFRIFYERSYILIILLLAQSFSSIILKYYESTLSMCGFLIYFMTMLTSTGGNSSSQTSALVIQGMAAGEINPNNIHRFLLRELRMAFMIAGVLSIFSFLRVYFTYGQLLGSFAVSLSLFFIVLLSVLLGAGIPIVLKRFNVDPAYAAGPFLATLMDIFGLLIYCYISKLILY
ncbi:MAG: Magnesium transporter MgtE [Candidatus Dependentiae bacterium ADurb.Bin331]|nr:MAG: Magnesium transporter MgtE [Candidatus Dependentiae bacterium ADurb.Bin331]